tara:strand:- start:351 stop:1118 length:768 start_codon:yes stop_codon:yes gene_type:complete
LIKKDSHTFRKKWGQNFLVDPNIIQKICKTIDPKSSDRIIEIGPGEGVLTKIILPEVSEMTALEIDPVLVKRLNNSDELKKLKIVNKDVLKINIYDLGFNNPVRIIGNIPYNITSQIIFWLIEQLDFWSDAFIMVQKEVAHRLTAKVGTKEYGRLTVVVGAYLDVDYCFTIPPSVFVPKPKVDSAFIHFNKKRMPLVDDEKYLKFNRLVRDAFNQRRKMLKNSLSGWNISYSVKDKVNFSRRPETLTIREFASLV